MGLFDEKPAAQTTTPTKQPTTIAAGTALSGDLTGGDRVQLDGFMRGNVDCLHLTIGQGGELHGEISVEELIVHGTFNGVIRAKKVLLGATAKVYGDVDHEVLEVEAGAEVEGRYTRALRQSDVTKQGNADTKKVAVSSHAGPMQKEAPPQAPKQGKQTSNTPSKQDIEDLHGATKH